MYKLVLDMVYRYTDHGLQLVGTLKGEQTVEEFVAINKTAFL